MILVLMQAPNVLETGITKKTAAVELPDAPSVQLEPDRTEAERRKSVGSPCYPRGSA